MNATKLNFTKRFMLSVAAIAGVVLLAFPVNAQDETTTDPSVKTQTETATIDTDRDEPCPRPRAGIKGGLNVCNIITDEVNDKKCSLWS